MLVRMRVTVNMNVGKMRVTVNMNVGKNESYC